MTVESLIHNVEARGASLAVEGDRLVIEAPRGALGREEVERLRAHKPELLAFIRAKQDRGQALALLQRLKVYTLPAGRMGAAREIAERCAERLVRWQAGEQMDEADDPASILAVVRNIERELIELGAEPNPGLAATVRMVEGAFPGARLVEVRRKMSVATLLYVKPAP